MLTNSVSPASPSSSSNTEYVSPFTAPAMPNLSKSPSASPRKVNTRRSPRSPLPPHKLAKLANALGISTPLPASNQLPVPIRRSSSARPADHSPLPDSRSVTPSTGSRPSTSRYLLHVVPPKHFPHESRNDPEAYAAFRRGSLVPLHSTLQAQLSAICREFQLPTTHGIVLYLVSDGITSEGLSSGLGKGPRISDEVWKWLWMRVMDEQPMLRGLGLGLSSGTSSPSELPTPLRKLSSSSYLETSPHPFGSYPLTPSPSSPSGSASASVTSIGQSQFKSSPPLRSNSSRSDGTSPTNASDTPATSAVEVDPRLLPGLGSPSLIPVLAKVEFDIDRRVGTWYTAWSRSRLEIQKRRGNTLDAQGKLQLRITLDNKSKRNLAFSDTGGYARLSDSPEQIDPDEELTAHVSQQEDPLADVFGNDNDTWSDLQSSRPREKAKDDLALDGASLSKEHESDDESHLTRDELDTNEVMALWNARNKPSVGLSYPTTPQSSQGSLKGTPQSSRKGAPPPLTLTPFGAAAAMEINIATPTPSPFRTDFTRDDDSHIAYLSERQDSTSSEDDKFREKRTGGIYDDVDLDLDLTTEFDPEESRVSQLKMQEELDILERSLAQLSPRELRTIELPPETTAPSSPYPRSAPPGFTSFAASSQTINIPSGHVYTSPNKRDTRRLVPTMQQIQPARPSMELEEEVTVSPPTFRQPVLVGTPSPVADSFVGVQRTNTANVSTEGSPLMGTRESLRAAWPAVPFTAVADRDDIPLTSSPKLKNKRITNSPPKLILNGRSSESTNSSPKQTRKSSLSSVSTLASVGASESLLRQQRYEEETANYPGTQSLTIHRSDGGFGSPTMPLSPDPFGRFPSTSSQNTVYSGTEMAMPPERTSSLARQSQGDTEYVDERPLSKTPSSRFSADSLLEEVTANAKISNRTTIMSVKSIKKLWRRTNKASVSGLSVIPSADPSPMPSRPPSSAASLHDTDVESPRVPSPSVMFSQGNSGMSSGRTSQASMRGGHGPFTQQPLKPTKRPDSGLDPFYFDQDSKYPVRRSPSPSTQNPYGGSGQTTPSTSSFPMSAPATATTTPVAEKKRSMRKSILKWKSVASSGSASSDNSAPRRSSDFTASEPRRRRPSILDATNGMMRGDMTMVSTGEQSPSVPELPTEYRMNRQSRVSVHNTSTNEAMRMARTQSTAYDLSRRKPVPSSSTDSSQASTDPIHTPISTIPSSSIANGNGLVSPGTSEDLRSSFDDSQFEIISPKVGQNILDSAHSISYPYNTIGHDD